MRLKKIPLSSVWHRQAKRLGMHDLMHSNAFIFSCFDNSPALEERLCKRSRGMVPEFANCI